MPSAEEMQHAKEEEAEEARRKKAEAAYAENRKDIDEKTARGMARAMSVQQELYSYENE